MRRVAARLRTGGQCATVRRPQAPRRCRLPTDDVLHDGKTVRLTGITVRITGITVRITGVTRRCGLPTDDVLLAVGHTPTDADTPTRRHADTPTRRHAGRWNIACSVSPSIGSRPAALNVAHCEWNGPVGGIRGVRNSAHRYECGHHERRRNAVTPTRQRADPKCNV